MSSCLTPRQRCQGLVHLVQTSRKAAMSVDEVNVSALRLDTGFTGFKVGLLLAQDYCDSRDTSPSNAHHSL